MSDGIFPYENCLLKHHVRVRGWLPLCQQRLALIRDGRPKNKLRRLRYFTFCAVGAIDVLMLDVADVIRRSDEGNFDTVIFFDKESEHVAETLKRIPGAIGFPGDFIKIVLLENPEEENILANNEVLAPAINDRDTAERRRRQLDIDQRQNFINCFPFDVINLDLTQFFFRSNDPFPGQMVGALRKIFAWQQKGLTYHKNPIEFLNGFSLMFTTQVGPPDLSGEYLDLIQSYLENNLASNADLRPIFEERSSYERIDELRNSNFDLFFKLGMPKVILKILMEQDWYVDPALGIKIFEFERTSKSGPYRMLHLVMDVKRKEPPFNGRAPGQESDVAIAAYHTTVEKLFREREILLTKETIDNASLQQNLDKIIARRRKYFPEVDEA